MRRTQSRCGDSGIAFVEVLIIAVILGICYGAVLMGIHAVRSREHRPEPNECAAKVSDRCTSP